MAAVAQYVTVLDRSNKVVGTTKHLKNVFKEAKAAYLERRAEIQADRRAQDDRYVRRASRGMEAMTLDDSDYASRVSGQSGQHSAGDRSRDYHERRPSLASHASTDSVRSSHRSRHAASVRDEEHVASGRSAVHQSKRSQHELVRRATDNAALASRQPRRSHTSPELERHVDMDLAYGDFHPDSLALRPREAETVKKQELSSLVAKCKMLLDEANCAQHSVAAIIAHLQRNPEAMAAVALTLAEISNLARHMPPGALSMIKGSAPSVFAMLAAPEFLIAVGVGVGLTVVMFGGYKIVKKIQAQAKGKEGSMDEAIEVGQLDRIEHWRRGIADADARDVETCSLVSHNTSVEGEFITPLAARSLGHLPPPKSHSGDAADRDGEKRRKKKKHHRTEGSTVRSSSSSRSTSGQSKRSSTAEVPKEKSLFKSSPLRRMLMT